MPWQTPGQVDDMELARLPFAEAQALLTGIPDRPAARVAHCEWHGAGPAGDPERGSFALVNADGPLVDLIGERIQVSYSTRIVRAYVHETAALDEDISLTRRLFMALAPLSTTEIQVLVTVLT